MSDQSRPEHRMPRRDHASLDERRRLLSVAVANHVRRDPAHITRALAWVDMQLAKPVDAGRWTLEQWHGLLVDALASPRGLRALLSVLEDRNEYAVRLRQSAPYAGVLSQPERAAILAAAAEAERVRHVNSTDLADRQPAADERHVDVPSSRVLHAAAFDRVVELIDSPPEPTASLRGLLADAGTTTRKEHPHDVTRTWDEQEEI